LVRHDALLAIQSSLSDLVLKAASYFYKNGVSRKLLCLSGTIVMHYKENKYNAPIEIWLEEDHPIVPPWAFVKPTADMYISPKCKYVLSDGRVILSYLESWNHVRLDLVRYQQCLFCLDNE
jgi:ESCRT-I complex subunit TSG101